MHIVKAVIQNYRALQAATVCFNKSVNIVVGDNESGKSTLLEALNLALTGQLNGRTIQFELHPFLFNQATVLGYIDALNKGSKPAPPKALIEVYFDDDANLAALKGTNNSLKENCPGVKITFDFDEDFKAEYAEYIKDPKRIRTIPIEYYSVSWLSFANAAITARSIPIKSCFIDASTIKTNYGTSRYILDIVSDYLSPEQRVQLSLSYRKMKDSFLQEEGVKAINTALAKKKGAVSEKNLSVSLDTTSKSNWEGAIMPQLDDIPMPLIGKGEQSSMKIKLAIGATTEAHVFLIEEPENHLSYSNLNKLIASLTSRQAGKQFIITTHSSFVLNKLGIASVLLFTGSKALTLDKLTPDTLDYFMKLPGHDTLRLILAKAAILVEGPSDELIVQKAFLLKHKCLPLQKGVDVITVHSLAFKRFLEIAKHLDINVRVVTDNDGDLAAVKKKYEDYPDSGKRQILYDTDVNFPTLEPQLLKYNNRVVLNKVLGTNHGTDDALLAFMKANKTDCALKIFNTQEQFNVPPYINKAIE